MIMLMTSEHPCWCVVHEKDAEIEESLVTLTHFCLLLLPSLHKHLPHRVMRLFNSSQLQHFPFPLGLSI